MSHIAVQEAVDGRNVDWLEPVSDDQYLSGPGHLELKYAALYAVVAHEERSMLSRALPLGQGWLLRPQVGTI